MSDMEIHEAVANYKIPCEVCGHKPTVDSKDSKGHIEHHAMCGACMWGEADCIDPNNW